MAFHGIMAVRDEGDIIAQVLAHVMSWLDSLLVYDTGSRDGTWEIVRELAARDRRVVAMGGEPVVFQNGLRAMIFDRARASYRDGDWVARLDGDEFYHVSPREFVRERVDRREGRVFAQMYDFLLTRAEVAAWERGEESPSARSRPIEERRRRYVVQEFPEPRLFRYRRWMKWPAWSYVPLCGGLPARARVPVRHYRWRDPDQAAARCALRRAMRAAGARTGPHWDLQDWRDWLADDADPRLLTHAPGAALPEPGLTNHLARGWRRGAQRAAYGLGLARAADLVLRGFDPAFRPEPECRGDGARVSFARPHASTTGEAALRT